MDIPARMLKDYIKAYANYLEYLAKYKGSASTKAIGRGKGLLTKEGVEIVFERVSIPKRRWSKTVNDEVRQSKEGADVILSKETEEDEEEPLLKALETLSKAAQFKLNMEKAGK
ncbi:hypothetical protein Tco_1231574, partial [Tanacetum coccineum]